MAYQKPKIVRKNVQHLASNVKVCVGARFTMKVSRSYKDERGDQVETAVYLCEISKITHVLSTRAEDGFRYEAEELEYDVVDLMHVENPYANFAKITKGGLGGQAFVNSKNIALV